MALPSNAHTMEEFCFRSRGDRHGSNGQIVLDTPADLPEGTLVEVVPVKVVRPALGMREEDWPTTPEGVAALLALA